RPQRQHGSLGQQLGRDPAWASAFINRVVRMVERDKNHPSIIIWSMGNETGFGPHHVAMAAWVRSYDPSRPIHNENAICEQAVRNRWEENPHGTDIICPMYPSVEDIENHARTSTDPRPLIMCEYAHAMGNSCGNLKEYWDAIENHHGLQGGFIWEWLDQGLLETANGIPYWAYGGDFGEERHDLNFVCDGLCWPDRAPHSSLIEYKHIIAPVAVTKVRGKTFRFFNKNWFTDFSQYVITWELLRNGEVVQEGHTRKLRTPPQASTDLKVDYELPPLRAGDEVSIVFTFRLARSLSWAPRGHVIAEEQIDITTRAPKSRPARKTGKAVVATKSADAILVHCGDMEVEFGNDGIHWRNNGREIINQGPMLNVWRAPIDNDGIKGRESQDGKPLGRWQALGIDHIKRTSSIISLQEIDKETANVNLRQIFNPATGQIDMETTFIVSADAIDVVHHFELSKALVDLPRLGVRLKLASDFEDFSWFGRGPHETYIDRRASGTVRIHHSTVENQYVPYILPQEHGNLTDVRWLELKAAE
ncbi:MAG: glycoside hydrolase family 2 TIM barrel-domain containing protein, partial [Pseudomonadales bacterium]